MDGDPKNVKQKLDLMHYDYEMAFFMNGKFGEETV